MRFKPTAEGLYDPRFEHDACGVAFVASLDGAATHKIVQHGLTALSNLDHRGGAGAEPESGDGAGILLQIPDAFFRGVVGFELPEAGHYAAGIVFLPDDDEHAAKVQDLVEQVAADEQLKVLGWRDLPVTPDLLGATARAAMPRFKQIFIASHGGQDLSGLDLDRETFVLRKRAEHETDVYLPSLSARTIVYKGMLTTAQLEPFFPDLSDARENRTWPPTSLMATCSGCTRSLTPRRATPPVSTRCWSCCTSVGAASRTQSG